MSMVKKFGYTFWLPMVSCNNQDLYFSGNAQNYGLVAYILVFSLGFSYHPLHRETL